MTLALQLSKGIVSITPCPHTPGFLLQLSWMPPFTLLKGLLEHCFLQGELYYYKPGPPGAVKEGLTGIMASLVASGDSPSLFCPRPERGVLGTTLLVPGGGERKAIALPAVAQVSRYHCTLIAVDMSNKP